MSIFSFKYHTHIQGVNLRLLDDKDFIYSSKVAILQQLFSKSGKGVDLSAPKLGTYLIEAHQNNLPTRFNKLYRWADKRYHYGLPKSNIMVEAHKQFEQATHTYLQQKHASQIQMVKFFLSAKDFYMVAWLKLIKEYGYYNNELTKLSQEKGFQVFLDDGILHLTQETKDSYSKKMLDNQGLAFNFGQCLDRQLDIKRTQSPVVVADDNFIRIYYKYQQNNTVHQAYFDLDLSDVPTTSSILNDSVYAIYRIADDWYFFAYDLYSSSLPELTQLIITNDDVGDYYPRLYIRLNQQDLYQSQDKSLKKNLKKAYQKVGLDNTVITQMLMDNIKKDNWQNIHGLYLFMGLPMAQIHLHKVMAEYAFRYFKRLYSLHGGKPLNQTIQDNVSSQVLSYEHLVYQVRLGTYNVAVGEFSGKFVPVNLNKKQTGYYHLIYRHLPDEYEEIIIQGLKQLMQIGNHGTIFENNDNNLVIPLDRFLIKDLSNKEKELLCHQCLHVHILFVKHIKEKWYETTIFKAVLGAVAIALTIVAPPAGASVGAYMQATLIAVVKATAVSLVLNQVINFMVEQGWIDIKTAGILKIAVSVATMAYGGGFDMSKILTAPNIMKVVNTSFDAYNQYITQEIKDIQKQHETLLLDYQNKTQVLKQIQHTQFTKVFHPTDELLKSNFIPVINVHHSVANFYAKHNQFNVVALSHGLIENLVQTTLTNKSIPPTLKEEVAEVLLIT